MSTSRNTVSSIFEKPWSFRSAYNTEQQFSIRLTVLK